MIRFVDAEKNRTISGSLSPGNYINLVFCNVTFASRDVALFLMTTTKDGTVHYEDVLVQCTNVPNQTLKPMRSFDSATNCYTFPVCHTSSFFLGYPISTTRGSTSKMWMFIMISVIVASFCIVGYIVRQKKKKVVQVGQVSFLFPLFLHKYA